MLAGFNMMSGEMVPEIECPHDIAFMKKLVAEETDHLVVVGATEWCIGVSENNTAN